MNAVLEAVRQMALMKNGGEENDLHLRMKSPSQQPCRISCRVR